MDELMEKLNGFLDAAAGVVQEYAPQTLDAALLVIRIDAVWSLCIGVVFILASWAAYKAAKIGYEKADWTFGFYYESMAIGGTMSAVICAAVGAGILLTPYNWIAAFDPMLGLVYKAAQSAGLL